MSNYRNTYTLWLSVDVSNTCALVCWAPSYEFLKWDYSRVYSGSVHEQLEHMKFSIFSNHVLKIQHPNFQLLALWFPVAYCALRLVVSKCDTYHNVMEYENRMAMALRFAWAPGASPFAFRSCSDKWSLRVTWITPYLFYVTNLAESDSWSIHKPRLHNALRWPFVALVACNMASLFLVLFHTCGLWFSQSCNLSRMLKVRRVLMLGCCSERASYFDFIADTPTLFHRCSNIRACCANLSWAQHEHNFLTIDPN